MKPSISILEASPGRAGSVELRLRNSSGELVAAAKLNPVKPGGFESAVKGLPGIQSQWLAIKYGEWEKSGASSTVNWEVPLPEPDPPFQVRARSSKDGSAGPVFNSQEPIEALKLALQAALPGLEAPVLTWDGTDRLAALDIDVDEGRDLRENGASLRLVAGLLPSPALWWETHGGGLRLIFHKQGDNSADELAACAAVGIAERDPRLIFEVKPDTRHPSFPREPGGPTGGRIRMAPQSPALGAVGRWLSGGAAYDEEDWAQWLSERGMEPGRRYDHDHCPARPGEGGDRKPVEARADHLFCYRCAARGVTLGSRVPGLFPASALAGGKASGPLRNCVRFMSHWEHAKHVVAAQAPALSESVARAAYKAALAAQHGRDDPRVAAVFAAGRDLVRLESRWATSSGQPYHGDISPLLAKLPAARIIDEQGKAKADAELVARLGQPVNLSAVGYPAVTPIWGTRIWTQFLPLPTPGAVPVILPSRDLAAEQLAWARPKYAPTGKRMIEVDALALIRTAFPGLDAKYLELLLVAKGIAEAEPGVPPLLFVSGVTGSAKTATVQVAAAIAGDSCSSVVWKGDPERARQAILEAKAKGSFVAFNEAIKEGRKSGGSALETMDFLLNLTPDSMSHVLYQGPVPLGTLPVCVWTDTELPPDVRRDAQLARRLVHVRTGGRVDWQTSGRDIGLSQIRWLRTIGREWADACDSILSNIIDRWFHTPVSFEEVAAELGYKTLEAAPEAEEWREELRALARAIISAPPASGADAKRWKGKGWAVAIAGSGSALSEAWSTIADAEAGPGWATSRRAAEVDWVALMGGKKGPVIFEHRAHGHGRVAMRFRLASTPPGEGAVVNGEVFNDSTHVNGRNSRTSKPSNSIGESKPSQLNTIFPDWMPP